jgi:hypothetical protein
MKPQRKRKKRVKLLKKEEFEKLRIYEEAIK